MAIKTEYKLEIIHGSGKGKYVFDLIHDKLLHKLNLDVFTQRQSKIHKTENTEYSTTIYMKADCSSLEFDFIHEHMSFYDSLWFQAYCQELVFNKIEEIAHSVCGHRRDGLSFYYELKHLRSPLWVPLGWWIRRCFKKGYKENNDWWFY